MKNYNKLVPDNFAVLLKREGYLVKGKKLKGDRLKVALCSNFLQEYNQTINNENIKQLQMHYADMLEIIRTLMVKNSVDASNLKMAESQPIMWYRQFDSQEVRLVNARKDLLQKFDEMLTIKNKEVMRDQIVDVFNSYRYLVEAHNLNFVQIEKERRIRKEKFGGFSQGVYLTEVYRVKAAGLER